MQLINDDYKRIEHEASPEDRTAATLLVYTLIIATAGFVLGYLAAA